MRFPMLTSVRLSAAVVLLGAALVSAEDKKAEADLKSVVGKWTVEKAELGGVDRTELFKALKFEILEGAKYSVEIGKEKDEGTFTVDPAKSPKEIDITSTAGPNKGKLIKAIYKIDGDTLTVCYELGTDKGTRPEKFESKPKTAVFLVTYKREKK